MDVGGHVDSFQCRASPNGTRPLQDLEGFPAQFNVDGTGAAGGGKNVWDNLGENEENIQLNSHNEAASVEDRKGKDRSRHGFDGSGDTADAAECTADTVAQVCESFRPALLRTLSAQEIVQRLKLVIKFAKNNSDKLEIFGEEKVDLVLLSLRPLLWLNQTEIKASTLRLIRYLLSCKDAIKKIDRLGIYLSVIYSMECRQEHLRECTEALKLVRAVIETDCDLLPRGVVRSLVSLSCKFESKFRNIALETLRLTLLRNPAIVAECNGVSCIVKCMTDPRIPEMGRVLALTIAHLLENHQTRKHVRFSLHLGTLLSPFTDLADNNDKNDRWIPCSNAIITLLSTWSGLLYLAADPRGLTSLIQMLVHPVKPNLRGFIIATFFVFFSRILSQGSITVEHYYDSTNAIYEQFLKADKDLKSSALARTMEEFIAFGPCIDALPPTEACHNMLLNQFVGVALEVFFACGIVESLVEICVNEPPPLSIFALQLLSMLMRASLRLLPTSKQLKVFGFSEFLEKAMNNEEIDSVNADELVRVRRSSLALSMISRTVGKSYDTLVATVRTRLAASNCVSLACQFTPIFWNSTCSHWDEKRSLPLEACVNAMDPTWSSKFRLPDSFETPRFPESTPQSSEFYSAVDKSSTSTVKSHYSVKLRRLRSTLSKPYDSKRTTADKDSGKEEHFSECCRFNSLGSSHDHGFNPNIGDNSKILKKDFQYQILARDLSRTAIFKVEKISSRIFSSNVGQTTEWRKWKWDVIDEIVRGPLREPALCVEISKSKFAKNLINFFKGVCPGDFPSLPWRVEYEAYAQICESMIHCFLNCGVMGITFLQLHDIHGQIIKALKYELQEEEDNDILVLSKPDANAEYGVKNLSQKYFLVNGRPENAILNRRTISHYDIGSISKLSRKRELHQRLRTQKRYFSPTACTRSMTRSFGRIIGSFTSCAAGNKLLDEKNFLTLMHQLSEAQNKEYILRLIVPFLDIFSNDPRYREFLSKLFVGNSCKNDSRSLSVFVLGYIRAQMHRLNAQDNKILVDWALNLFLSVLPIGGDVSIASISALNEIVYYENYKARLVSLDLSPLLPFVTKSYAKPLLFKLAGTDAGFTKLRCLNWVDSVAKEWASVESIRYTMSYEAIVASNVALPDQPVHIIDRCYETNSVNEAYGTHGPNIAKEKVRITPDTVFSKGIPITVSNASAKGELGFHAKDVLPLYLLPWAGELWMKTEQGYLTFIPVQTYFHTAFVSGPTYGTSSCARIFEELQSIRSSNEDKTIHKQRRAPGNVSINPMDHENCVVVFPYDGTIKFSKDMTLYTCLTLGGQILMQNGRTQSPVGSSRQSVKKHGSRAQGKSTWPLQEDKGMHRDYMSSSIKGQNDYLQASLTSHILHLDIDDENWWLKCNFSDLVAQSSLSFADDIQKDASEQATDVNFEFNVGEEKAKNASNSADTPRIFHVCPKPNSSITYTFCERGGAVFLECISFHIAFHPLLHIGQYIPTHFFGELARSGLGNKYLSSSIYVDYAFRNLVDPSAAVRVRQAAMWDIANIGSTENGISFLLDSKRFRIESEKKQLGIIDVISNIATLSDILPLRGTAICVLGLFSKTARGRALLSRNGWQLREHHLEYTGFVVTPKSSSCLLNGFDVSEFATQGCNGDTKLNDSMDIPSIPGTPDKIVQSAFDAISKTMNKITFESSRRALLALKSKFPELFKSPQMLMFVHRILENVSCISSVRSFLLRLFQEEISFAS